MIGIVSFGLGRNSEQVNEIALFPRGLQGL